MVRSKKGHEISEFSLVFKLTPLNISVTQIGHVLFIGFSCLVKNSSTRPKMVNSVVKWSDHSNSEGNRFGKKFKIILDLSIKFMVVQF